ncbi:DUF4398 domain-containing protein [Chondromyces crocatus]|uniref:DUF4398 domain-containing protein n=1 Tax=Chondromyces crocatus TaxID=52 RepID=A0A0K1ER77_CHOCO|nr:DUF4398 domain-containing protein [Chondromyces crocatus]AKT43103.1 uncharacterized protein CMC5_073310 [Chondromyces crocatus]
MKSVSVLTLLIPLAAGCASLPAPTEQLASSEAAVRGAREVGAASVPQASLELRLAEEGIAKAKAAMAEDDNEKAERLLRRAQADAELALSMARETKARNEAAQVMGQVSQLRGQMK